MTTGIHKYAMLLMVALSTTGCADMHYSQKMVDISNGVKSGDITNSIAKLESNNPGEKKDLLYFMEKGELLRLNGAFKNSRDTLLRADSMVREWEDQVKKDPSQLLGDVGSVLLNDTTRRYDGRDYEKTLLNISLALNHLDLGNWEDARIEIRKMHERQAIIAEFRSKELEKAKDDADKKGIKATSFKEIKGYPIETLEAPEVQNLKNSYESALGHYLAGFVYEALGETSMAAPGYRKAAEMRPNEALLDNSLAELDNKIRDQRKSAGTKKPAGKKKSNEEPKSGEIDTLFVIESGLAPAIQSQQLGFFVPVPCSSGVCPTLIQMSWPTIAPSMESNVPSAISVDGKDVPSVFLTSVDAMSKRALYDEMPGIVTRSAIRAVAKAVAQKATDEATSRASGALGPFGGLVSVATKAAVAATEVADERAWRTLPGAYSIARSRLSSGPHKVSIQLGGITKDVDVAVNSKNKYAVVTLRIVGDQIYTARLEGDTSIAGFDPTKANDPNITDVSAKADTTQLNPL